MFRQNTYQEGKFGFLQPVHRQMVVPGQSLSGSLRIAWETAPFLNNILSGGICSLYTFYVPYRLLWEQWVEFVARDDTAPATVPTTTTAWPSMFEAGGVSGQTYNVFMRRAYKLAYNQYFGQKDFGSAYFYEDIEADTDVTLKVVRGTDQFLGKVMPQSDLAAPVLSVPVTGTAPNQVADIPLNQLRRELTYARSLRRADMTGDKYVDAMARMGVKLDWRVQNAPEMLAVSHMDFGPKETRATFTGSTGPDTGQAFARFQETGGHNIPRRFFAEHGVVFTAMVVRLTVVSDQPKPAIDSTLTGVNQFFLGDNQELTDSYPGAVLASSEVESVQTPSMQYLHSGQNLAGNVSPVAWFVRDASTEIRDRIYPVYDISAAPVLGSNNYAVYTRSQITNVTPVRKNVF